MFKFGFHVNKSKNKSLWTICNSKWMNWKQKDDVYSFTFHCEYILATMQVATRADEFILMKSILMKLCHGNVHIMLVTKMLRLWLDSVMCRARSFLLKLDTIPSALGFWCEFTFIPNGNGMPFNWNGTKFIQKSRIISFSIVIKTMWLLDNLIFWSSWILIYLERTFHFGKIQPEAKICICLILPLICALMTHLLSSS